MADGGGVGVDTCRPPLAPTYSITGTFDAEDATLLPETEGRWDTTLHGVVRPRWDNNGDGDVIYSRVVLTLADGTVTGEADDDELVPGAVPLPVTAANITTPEVPPLPEPEADGVLPVDPFPGLPAEDRM